MSIEVQLASGRTIVLKELRQVLVYEGVIEGVPTTRDNEHLVATLLAEVSRQFKVPVQLVAPSERVLDRPATRRGQPALIPKVASTGRFESSTPVRDSSMHGSHLVLLWFQDEFGLPEPAALERLRTIEWDAAAADFEH